MALARNILFFHLGALGDFVVTWPLVMSLARLHPQSRIFVVTHGQKGKLAEKALRVESLDVDSGGWHGLFEDLVHLPMSAARVLAGAHTVVTFLAADQDRWSHNVRAINADAKLISLESKAPDDFAGRQSEFLVDQLDQWPVLQTAARQIMLSIAERGLGLRGNSHGPIVIHPGGGTSAKCWAADRYLSLIGQFHSKGLPTVVLLGEVELEKWPAALIQQFRDSADVHTPADLVDLYARIAGARLFIGNDSGPGHLAGFLGIPTLSLHGASSNPVRWRPIGPQVHLIHRPLEQIDVAEVQAAAAEILASRE